MSAAAVMRHPSTNDGVLYDKGNNS